MEVISINIATLLIVEIVFIGFIIGVIIVSIDDYKRNKKKNKNIGLPKLENFSSAPMPKCKPVKRPPSQFKNEYVKYLDSNLEHFEMTDNEKFMLKKTLEKNGVVERNGDKMDREKIKEYAEILEEIESLEAMVKAYENENKSNWIASTKLKKCGLTSSYEFNISRKESKERFLEWIKNEIKLLEELIKE